MRQTHAAGEKLFVDFAGDTVPVFDGLTGQVRTAKIFVAVLGARTPVTAAKVQSQGGQRPWRARTRAVATQWRFFG
jgi:transposase